MANAIDIERPNQFAAYASAVRSHTFDGLLLKFVKGDWLAGPDGDLIEEGTQLVAIMSEFKLGWQKMGRPQAGRVDRWPAYRPLHATAA
jgi:hypothetical protein